MNEREIVEKLRKTFGLKTCSKCGEKCVAEYNKQVCPDCAVVLGRQELSSLGSEDMVDHFRQDIGFRLQRYAWGHFC